MKYGSVTLGQIEAIINKLGGEEGMMRFLSGCVEVTTIRHLIDCNAAPFVPEDWSVEEHRKGGMLKWDPNEVTLHLSEHQKDGKVIVGTELHRELKRESVLNANVLDYLRAHPALIPEEWKGKYVFFWGTIYRNPSGSLCVRFLYFDGGKWYWDYFWLDFGWSDNDPAASLAS